MAAASTEAAPTELEAEPRTLRQLTVQVPSDAQPGHTKLRISPNGEAFALLVQVPPEASAGDLLVLQEQLNGDWTLQSPKDSPPVTICLNYIPSDTTAAFRAMVAAAQEDGAYISPKLERAADLAVPGLSTNEDIEKGEVLIRMPARLHISPKTCRRLMPKLYEAVAAASNISEARRGEVAQTACVATLLRAASFNLGPGLQPGVEGESPFAKLKVPSLWKSYSESLLGEDFEGHPYWRALKELDVLKAALEPSAEAAYARMMGGDAIAIHELVVAAVPAEALEPPISVGDFLQGRLCLLTREFGTPAGSALVPIADLCNHSATPGAVQRWSFDDDAMIVVATRAHERGDEVCITYGTHSAPLLLRTYGFTLHPSVESTWTFACQAAELVQRCRERCGREAARALDGSFLPMTEVHFDSAEVTPTLVSALEAFVAASQESDPRPFLRDFCQTRARLYEADPSLAPSLKRLEASRSADPQSICWWAEDEMKQEVDAEMALRVKMSEYLCLTAHMEACDLASVQQPERCLAVAAKLSASLGRIFPVKG